MKVLKIITGDAAVNTKDVTVRLNVNSTYICKPGVLARKKV